jgi:hypothetical protein
MPKEITLTSEVYALFNEHGHLFERPKNVWTQDQMAIVYLIYNTLTGKMDKDTGCSSCRTTHVNHVRRAYEQYKTTL